MLPVEMSTFGARLRALRRGKGLSQLELARAVGRHQSVIGPYERDEYMPPGPIVERLAAVLDTSPEYLLFGRTPGRTGLAAVGEVVAGGLVRAQDGAGAALFELREDGLALVSVRDASMAPVFEAGTLALVETVDEAPSEAHYGRTVLAELADGRVLLRRLMPAAARGRYDLAAFNAPTLHGVELRRVRLVRGCLERAAFAA